MHRISFFLWRQYIFFTRSKTRFLWIAMFCWSRNVWFLPWSARASPSFCISIVEKNVTCWLACLMLESLGSSLQRLVTSITLLHSSAEKKSPDSNPKPSAFAFEAQPLSPSILWRQPTKFLAQALQCLLSAVEMSNSYSVDLKRRYTQSLNLYHT